MSTGSTSNPPVESTGTTATQRNRKSSGSQHDNQPRGYTLDRAARAVDDGYVQGPSSPEADVDVADCFSGLKIASTEAQPTHISKQFDPKIHKDLRLPPGHRLDDEVKTSVETVVRPAVEQEIIEQRRIEITQPVIERDIHVHHYYEYEQPVQVTEVLPARHWGVDRNTQRRVEIEPPLDWKMPRSLSPRKVSTEGMKRTHRHYLVDEAHPHGVPEDPEVGTIPRAFDNTVE